MVKKEPSQHISKREACANQVVVMDVWFVMEENNL